MEAFSAKTREYEKITQVWERGSQQLPASFEADTSLPDTLTIQNREVTEARVQCTAEV